MCSVFISIYYYCEVDIFLGELGLNCTKETIRYAEIQNMKTIKK